ncbi:MAG: sulfatase [Opitutales bacterium]|nr:sulfatase [Opitutales bacterium]MBT5813360.1 sulfatase [Opitutales bacterium]MBT7867556.1 sulfatase [Opitutales bacterium]MDG2254285.1 sulfatase [Opitutaceae bacterium]
MPQLNKRHMCYHTYRFSFVLIIANIAFGLTATEHPNILFIVADDLTADALGTYGNEVCQTPNIDRLAREGVQFDRAYCQYPVCGASRASFMSGLYPETTGFLGNIKALGSYKVVNLDFAEHPSIGGFLRRNGYVSARVSKIYHMGVPGGIEAGEPGGDEPDSWDRAYDVWSPETSSPGVFSNLSPKLSHWGSGFVKIAVPDELASTQADEVTATQVIGILENRALHRNKTNFLKAGEPLFLAVGLIRPHVPLVAPERLMNLYNSDNVKLPEVPKGDLEDVPVPNRMKANFTNHKMTAAQAQEAKAAYYACVTYMDEQVGRILDALDRLEMTDNTVVVFISDHGWLLGEHDSWQKSNLFDPACRVPLIVRAPGFEKNAGKTVMAAAELIDLYPTFADLAGLGDEAPSILQGHSLVPLLEKPNRKDWVRGSSYTVLGNKKAVHNSIRSGQYRYSLYKGGEEELYDHQNDPDEFTNQANNPEYGPVIGNLRGMIQNRISDAASARD